MTNPLRGEVTVAGTDIKLTFDVNAFCMAEMALGKTTDVIIAEYEAMRDALVSGKPGSVNFPLLRALYWAGRQRHGDSMIDEAADEMSDIGIVAVRDAIGAGMLAAFGGAREGEKSSRPRRKKAPAGNG